MALDIEHYKTRLLELQKELQDIDVISEDTRKVVELDQTTVGRLSRMDAMQQQEMALATARRRKMQLTRIEQALARIDSGDYGYCASCDEEISSKRLDLDPSQPACVECSK